MLGSLEKRILSVLHKERKINAREIYQALKEEGMAITYVTVNTVLSRLYKRGLVNRTKEPFRGTFRYTYEYKDIEDELITSLLGDVDILFGKDGIDHLKMKLDAKKDQEIADAEEKGILVSNSIPSPNMRIKLSRNDAQNSIIKKVENISEQNISACYQCGKCSAGCPMVTLMDLLPNQIIRLVQLGQINDVLKSKTIWLCASCFACTARCPKGVDLAKVMEALRLLLLRKSTNYVEPSKLDIDENLPQIALVSNFRKMTG
ncbi:MAG: 4Fe-4S dicluster domain-containing protein [Thermoplasmatales archaeon]|nr:MAG: 4Fe-4S dicluster domain-containing protein [Thermoplasmatales archaeon]